MLISLEGKILTQFIISVPRDMDTSIRPDTKQGKAQHEHPWHTASYICPPGGFNLQ